jgi:hypothetical protein
LRLYQIYGPHSGYTVYENGSTLTEAAISGELTGSMPSPTIVRTISPTMTGQWKMDFTPSSGAANLWAVWLPRTPQSSSDGGLFEIGTNFSGSGAGHYVGNSGGQFIALNAPSAYSGDFINAENQGTTEFSVGSSGGVYAQALTLNGLTASLPVVSDSGKAVVSISYNTFAGNITSGIVGTAISSGTVAPARLGSGTTNSTTILHGDSTWSALTSTDTGSVPTTRTLTMTGTTNQVVLSAGAQDLSADRTWTFSLPQNIHTGASPTFVGLNLSGLSASLPVVTDASKNIASVSYATFFGNLALTGDATSSGQATTVVKIQGNAVKSAAPNNNDVLTWVTANTRWEPIAWATGLPAATTAGRLPYDNGSSYSMSAAGSTGQTLRMAGTVPTFNSVLTNDGSTIGITPAASNIGLTINGVASAKGLYITGNNTPLVDLLNTAQNCITATTTTALGATSGATIVAASDSAASTAGKKYGAYNWAKNISGTQTALGSFGLYSDGDNSGTNRDAKVQLQVGTAGANSLTVRHEWRANGDNVLIASGSENATNATGQFVFIGTCNGVPTGVPTNSYTGAIPIIIDRSNNRLYAYIGSAWVNLTQGRNAVHVITISGSTNTTYAMSAADYGGTGDTTGASTGVATFTLPSIASATPYCNYFFAAKTGNISNTVINRAGSDTFDGGGTSITLTSGQTKILWTDGAVWFTK